MFLSCLSRFCPVASVFLLLLKNTECVSLKFMGDGHYREQIK